MRSVVVGVWRGTHNVAVVSVSDEKFLADLKRWMAKQKDYELTFRENTLGPEHQ
jgi:hypothetical protein